MDGTRSKDPLRTLEVLVGCIVALMAVLACAVLVGTIAGSGSIPGVNAEVCVSTSAGQPGFRTTDADTTGPVGLEDGIRWHAERVQICDGDPDGTTRALAATGLLVWVGAPMLFFGLLWSLLRRARREGVFADRIPRGLRRLGTTLLVWAALHLVVTGLVNAALLTRMTEDTLVLFMADAPWLLVLLGVAFLALERVVAQAVDLRHDVESTI